MDLFLKPHSFLGTLVTVDGIDGSGKTTLVAALKDYLDYQNICPVDSVIYTMPSKEARNLSYFDRYAQKHTSALANSSVDFVALCLILLGDRLMTVRTEIVRRLKEGHWVLCDRYIYTAFAELMFIGCSQEESDVLKRIAHLFPAPDLSVITDVSVPTAIHRIRQRPTESHTLIDESVFQQFSLGYKQLSQENNLTLISTELPQASSFGILQQITNDLLVNRLVSL